ncbi:MAG TPA: radical SAM protein [Spirochaetia bacterium]
MDEPLDIYGLTSEAFGQAASRLLPSGAGIFGRVYAEAFARGRLEPELLGASSVSAAAWRRHFRVALLQPRRVVEEEGDLGPTRKAVLTAADGREVECVNIPMPGHAGEPARHTLCLSSQAGCRMGCAFCETGRRGLARDLTAAEIVAEVVTARVLLGWDCRNLVFMGMGEPLDNFPALAQALAILMDRRGFAYAAERITICTCGPAGGIARLAGLDLGRMNLSISLNAGDDTMRNRLMPVNRGNGLAALAAELRSIPRRKNFVLGVNYCLIPGLNDSRDDARRAAAWCGGVGRTLLNLIPYNPGTRPIGRAPTDAETARFAGWLGQEGLEVRRRTAKGSSIMAGCGQLGAAESLQTRDPGEDGGRHVSLFDREL